MPESNANEKREQQQHPHPHLSANGVGNEKEAEQQLVEWDFFVPASDNDGHSVRFNIYIQPGHRRQITLIRVSGRFPFKTDGDLVRFLIKRGLDWLLSFFPDDDKLSEVASISKQVEAIMEIVKGDEFQSDFRRTFDAIAPRVADYLAEGQADQARGLVARMAGLIADMPGGYWQNKYKEELARRFGYLLQLPGPAPLNLADLIGEE